MDLGYRVSVYKCGFKCRAPVVVSFAGFEELLILQKFVFTGLFFFVEKLFLIFFYFINPFVAHHLPVQLEMASIAFEELQPHLTQSQRLESTLTWYIVHTFVHSMNSMC